jgi:hypothetical protein
VEYSGNDAIEKGKKWKAQNTETTPMHHIETLAALREKARSRTLIK